ncbi:MAG TPA: DciA family protein [Rhodocyclaceae bacterium]|jgi:hypothetical protein
MAANSLGKFIKTDSGLARYTAQVGRLLQLQRAYEKAVPAALLRSGRVANLKQGVVVIYASSGAAAVKIRQVAPRLTDVFRQIGPEINEVQVKVQPTEPHRMPPPIAGGSLKDVAKQGLEKLSSQLPSDSPLRKALEHFTRHVKIRKPD